MKLSTASIISAAHEDPVVQEYRVRRRSGRKPRSEKLPDHLERVTTRFEPKLQPGIELANYTLLGVDAVEVMEYRRGKPWVRRFEYPKYKLPPVILPPAAPLADSPAIVEVDTAADVECSEAECIDIQDGSLVNSSIDRTSSSQPLPDKAASTHTPPVTTHESVRRVCRIDTHGIIQAPREPTLIEGGHFGFSMGAEVLFNKFGLHLPLHRQQDSLAQSGWSPSRSTLGLIVTHCAALLTPLVTLLRDRGWPARFWVRTILQ